MDILNFIANTLRDKPQLFMVIYVPGFILSISLGAFFISPLLPSISSVSKQILESVLFLMVLPFVFGMPLHLIALMIYGYIIKKLGKMKKGTLPEKEGYKLVYRNFLSSTSLSFLILSIFSLIFYKSLPTSIFLILLFLTFSYLTYKLYLDVEDSKTMEIGGVATAAMFDR